MPLHPQINTLPAHVQNMIQECRNEPDPVKQGALVTKLNQMFGIVKGHEREMFLYQRMQAKGRPVILQTHGDVTTGAAGDRWAKTIEVKVTTSPDSTAVDQQLKKAFAQITRAAAPGKPAARPSDHRKIHLTVEVPGNTWPWSAAQWAGLPNTPTGAQMATQCCQRVVELSRQGDAQQHVRAYFRAFAPLGANEQFTHMAGAHHPRTTAIRVHDTIGGGYRATPIVTVSIVWPGWFDVENDSVRRLVVQMIADQAVAAGQVQVRTAVVKIDKWVTITIDC